MISGGNFKPDTLKPKEVVSLLLDDDELEKKRELGFFFWGFFFPETLEEREETEGINCLSPQCASGRRRRGNKRRAARSKSAKGRGRSTPRRYNCWWKRCRLSVNSWTLL